MSAIAIIVLDIFFAYWASIGSSWYFYLLNFVVLFLASSIFNTSFIHGITIGYAYINLYGLRGVLKALGVNILTLLCVVLSYFISSFAFSINYQIYLFFIACTVISIFVAVSDGLFKNAINKERTLNDIFQGIEKSRESEKNQSQYSEIRIYLKNEYNIFVIDDEPSIHMLISEELIDFFQKKNIKANVSSFLDAEAAVSKLHILKPDIIISCIFMPGMNGIDFLKICKKELPHTPFIFYSAYQEIIYGDNDAFIHKSSDPTILLNEIEKQLTVKKPNIE